MSSIIVINDPHLADHAPGGRAEPYLQEGLTMLEEVVKLANAGWEIEAVVCTGDLFHVKQPSRNSLRMLVKVVDILSELKCGPMIIAPGNHDMGPGGFDGLIGQPLGLLEAAGVITYDEWVKTKSFTIYTVPYHEKFDTTADHYWPHPSDPRHGTVVMAAHGSVVPDGVTREFPTLAASKALAGDADVLACGHIHEDLGVHRYGKKVYLNIGSLGRTARTQANMTRTVKLAVVGADKSVTELPLTTALPANIAFRQDAPVVETDDEGISEFVKALAADTGFEQLDLSDFIRQVCREAGMSSEIEKRLLSYVEEAA